MPATPTDVLLAEANCFRCYGSPDIATLLRLAILARTALAADPAADVTPQGLLTYGTCYRCFGISEAQVMEISLNDIISQALAA